MYIYRIEHDTIGCGPYAGEYPVLDGEISSMGQAHTNDRHPGMWYDCNLHQVYNTEYHASDYYCGFDSLDKLHAWFDGWLDILANNHFHIVRYRINRRYVITGTYQSVFVKEQTTQKKALT